LRILVLQHARIEHPGVFRRFLAEDGHEWVPVYVDEGDALPSLDDFDALWVMGGPMDVWEEDSYPWLAPEKALIAEAVRERGLPFLGLCLGHQLLADALGGSCGPAETPELGVMPVQLTEVGASGIFLDGVPETFDCLQLHGAEVKVMPAGASCLATAPACAVQAMSWGPRAYSMQFHLEVEPDTIDSWMAVPGYAQFMTSALGESGVQRLRDECAARMHQFNAIAERVYINWLQTGAQA
jgi:GMP synthase-like glutamine amidotransferase